jgi:hypothetical protein
MQQLVCVTIIRWSQLSFVILSAVQHTEHNDGIAFNSEKQFVRKPVSENSTKLAIINREIFWIGFQSEQRLRDCGKKFIAQASAALLVPVVRSMKIGLSRGAN